MLGGVANPELRNPATAGHHGDGAALGQEIRERHFPGPARERLVLTNKGCLLCQFGCGV
jgi:hypothetical protein